MPIVLLLPWIYVSCFVNGDMLRQAVLPLVWGASPHFLFQLCKLFWRNGQCVFSGLRFNFLGLKKLLKVFVAENVSSVSYRCQSKPVNVRFSQTVCIESACAIGTYFLKINYFACRSSWRHQQSMTCWFETGPWIMLCSRLFSCVSSFALTLNS